MQPEEAPAHRQNGKAEEPNGLPAAACSQQEARTIKSPPPREQTETKIDCKK
jgi:hypothetical protein